MYIFIDNFLNILCVWGAVVCIKRTSDIPAAHQCFEKGLPAHLMILEVVQKAGWTAS